VSDEQRATNDEQRNGHSPGRPCHTGKGDGNTSAQADPPLVDCHVHMRGLNSIPNLNAIMEACGLDAINILAATPLGDENLGQNCYALLFKVLHPGRYYAFGAVRHPESGEMKDPLPYEEQARRAIAAGCDGMKMMEGKPTARKQFGKALDAPQYDPYYAYLEEESIPLLFHVADPAAFWDPDKVSQGIRDRGWFYGDGTFPSKEQLYREVDGLLEKHPRLRVVFAHFYFLSAELERLGAFLDRWPNVNVDLTPGGEMYGNFSAQRDAAREFFIRYQDRIFFGTDNAGGRRTPNPDRTAAARRKIDAMRRFLSTDDEFEFWGCMQKGLALPRDACEKIYAGNFRRWAGAEPKPVKLDLAVEECDRVIALAKNAAVDAEIVDGLEQARQMLAGAGR